MITSSIDDKRDETGHANGPMTNPQATEQIYTGPFLGDEKFILKSSPVRTLNFKPGDDITPLESAYIAHFFAMAGVLSAPEDYPEWETIKRHFVEK